jgi:hypothetical protein
MACATTRIGVIVAACIAVAAGLVATGGGGQPDALAPVQFLLGEWRGEGAGEPGQGGGSAAFTRELQGRVIVRRSFAEYPPGGGRPGFRHDDLMVVFAEPSGSLRADYYDSEGHVIRYAVETPEVGHAVFVSAPSPEAPRFRLSYRLRPDGKLEGTFETAPPGKPEAFTIYLTWVTTRTTADSPTR